MSYLYLNLTLPTDDDHEVQQNAEFQDSSENPEFDTYNKMQWDYSCPWSEWYSADDPVKGMPIEENTHYTFVSMF